MTPTTGPPNLPQSSPAFLADNPFVVESPEKLTPDQTVALFVTEYTALETVRQRRHTIVWGSRGSGKSMMLRYLEPRCQQIAAASGSRELKQSPAFVGVYCPCKEGHLNRTEFQSLDETSARVLSEHLLNITVASRTVSCIRVQFESALFAPSDLEAFVRGTIELFDATSIMSSKRAADAIVDVKSDPLSWLQELFKSEAKTLAAFLRQSCLDAQQPPYVGATTGYHDFLLPYFRNLGMIPALSQAPVYLLVDDADRLNREQQAIVNSWIANRDHNTICVKVCANREGYKTLQTSSGSLIEQPHDYSEVDVEDIYTRSKSDYAKKVRLICDRRLALSVVPQKSIDGLLPINANEQALLDEIKTRTAQEWKTAGETSDRSDYVTRLASARLFQELKRRKRRKSYAGFQTLVHLSSGIVRDFLEPCYLMVDACVKKGRPLDQLDAVPVAIQDETIYQYSEEFLYAKFEDIRRDLPPEHWRRLQALRTLIESMGRLLYERLHDPAAKEARLFSFTVSGPIPADIDDVLRLGLKYRYFQQRTYSSKGGGGREPWFILNRRLCPVFKLDPSGFEGRVSLTPEHLRIACEDPADFLRLKIGARPLDHPSLFPDQVESGGGETDD